MSTTLDPAVAALLERIAPAPSPYTADPVRWAAERIGAHLWSKQREILTSLVEHKRTAVHSCHGVGKSFTAALACCWWIDVHPPGSALVASTAPTYKQVHLVLWEEIRKMHRRGRLPGVVNLSDEWLIERETVGVGRKPADHDEHGFQGLHRDYLLAVIDEACGVPQQLWTAVEAITTNDDARILAIGNPDDPATEFGRVCQSEDVGWNVIHIDAFDSPNFTGEPVPEGIAKALTTPSWAEDQLASWGEESPTYQSKVRGRFSRSAKASVVPGHHAEACREGRDYHNKDLETRGQFVELGVDIGAGGDETVIAGRFGPLARILLRDRNPDTMHTTGLVMAQIREHRPRAVKLDVIGIGKGVVDRLREMKADGNPDLEGVAIHGVNVGARADDPDHFPKLRDQVWWEVGRGLSETRGWDLSEIPERTIAELCAPQWQRDSSGRVKVEAKAETRLRLPDGRSPDSADALLLAFYSPAAGQGTSYSGIPTGSEPVYQRGDLRLVGRRYIDKEA